jgi:hypothetical protein
MPYLAARNYRRSRGRVGGEFLPREELEARGEGGGVDGGEDVADELITGGVSGCVRHAKLDKLQ